MGWPSKAPEELHMPDSVLLSEYLYNHSPYFSLTLLKRFSNPAGSVLKNPSKQHLTLTHVLVGHI